MLVQQQKGGIDMSVSDNQKDFFQAEVAAGCNAFLFSLPQNDRSGELCVAWGKKWIYWRKKWPHTCRRTVGMVPYLTY